MFVLLTAWKDLRRRLRDPAVFGIWLGIPLGLGGTITLAFGGLSDGTIPTAEIWVSDQDESALSGMLVTGLSAGGDFGFPLIAREVKLAEGHRQIEGGNGSALLIIPENFGGNLLDAEPTRLELITNPTQSVLPQMVEESLRLVVDAAFYLQLLFGEPISRIAETTSGGNALLESAQVAEIAVLTNDAIRRMEPYLNPPLIELDVVRAGDGVSEAEKVQGPGIIDIFLPSMLFLALVFMSLGISEDIWVEKNQGTLRRALATPNASVSFLIGKLLAAVVLMGSISLVALIGARFLLNAQISNIVPAAFWCMLSGAVFLALAYPLQLSASSQRAGGILSSLIMMPLMMIGGGFFPFELMPDGLARIGRLTPNGWAQTELTGILRDESQWGRIAISAFGLIVLGTVLIFIANRKMAGRFIRS